MDFIPYEYGSANLKTNELTLGSSKAAILQLSKIKEHVQSLFDSCRNPSKLSL